MPLSMRVAKSRRLFSPRSCSAMRRMLTVPDSAVPFLHVSIERWQGTAIRVSYEDWKLLEWMTPSIWFHGTLLTP